MLTHYVNHEEEKGEERKKKNGKRFLMTYARTWQIQCATTIGFTTRNNNFAIGHFLLPLLTPLPF